MPEVGDEIDDAERVAALADRHRDAWQRTLNDAETLAEQREEDGWETLVIPAGDTAPEPPEAGDSDRYGLVHVIPSNFADDFEALSDEQFSAYDVYRAESDGRVFVVTELLEARSDDETESDGESTGVETTADESTDAETGDSGSATETADGESTDGAAGLAVYVVGTYELRHAGDLIETAIDADLMYTHLQRLDGTEVASILHEDPEKFFPQVDRFVDDA
ncbi:MAG: hypothetical protein ABEH80_03105 [Halobaculum sp.]